jgi:hypothetical protein
VKFWHNERREAAKLLERLRSEGLDLFQVVQSGDLLLVRPGGLGFHASTELQAEVTRLRKSLLELIAREPQP